VVVASRSTEAEHKNLSVNATVNHGVSNVTPRDFVYSIDKRPVNRLLALAKKIDDIKAHEVRRHELSPIMRSPPIFFRADVPFHADYEIEPSFQNISACSSTAPTQQNKKRSEVTAKNSSKGKLKRSGNAAENLVKNSSGIKKVIKAQESAALGDPDNKLVNATIKSSRNKKFKKSGSLLKKQAHDTAIIIPVVRNQYQETSNGKVLNKRTSSKLKSQSAS